MTTTKCPKCGSLSDNFGGFYCGSMNTLGEFVQSSICEMRSELSTLRAENLKMVEALKQIAEHKFISYEAGDNSPMYDGQYGIGVTDGHRACAIIARAVLSELKR